MDSFQLNERIANDSFLIGSVGLCQIRLINDCRWPWLLMIPQRNGLTELHDLSIEEQEAIAVDTNRCATILKKLTSCQKINSGVLGNIVQQLHIHVVARSEGDPNWPNPVWGFETAQPYTDAARDSFIEQLKAIL